jgi:hypothetical protein
MSELPPIKEGSTTGGLHCPSTGPRRQELLAVPGIGAGSGKGSPR